MQEKSRTVRLLRSTDGLRMVALSSALDTLALPAGGHGLDAGCGIGSHTGFLLQATAPGGRVTGLDSSAEHLAVAKEAAKRSGWSGRVALRLGDVKNLPFEADTFDWAWSVDCVGFIPGDPVEMLRGLARVVRPGGKVALALWSLQSLLPGYPFLEASLNGTAAGAAPASRGLPPHRHPLRALRWFDRAGLRDPAVGTFSADVRGPLREGEKEALASIMEMRWGDPEGELPEGEVQVYRRIADRKSRESILDLEDYYGFFTYSLFSGIVPG